MDLARYVAIFVPVLVVSACVAVACETYQDLRGDPGDLTDTTVSQAEVIDRLEGLVREVTGVLPSRARSVNLDGAGQADVSDT